MDVSTGDLEKLEHSAVSVGRVPSGTMDAHLFYSGVTGKVGPFLCSVVNICVGGALIQSPAHIDIGDICILQLYLKDFRKHISMTCRIVRQQPGTAGGKVGYGIEFIKIPDELRILFYRQLISMANGRHAAPLSSVPIKGMFE